MNRTLAVLIAVISLAAVATQAGAAEQPKVKKAWFKVTLEGVQKDNWNAFHQGGAHRCDATVSQKGSEVVRFRSKPVLMQATDMEGLSNPVLFKKSDELDLYPFRLRGTVTRQSQVTASPVPRDCSGTGGGGVPAKDCGTKSIRGLRANVSYFYAKPYGRLQVRSSNDTGDVFRNCGGGSQGYPHLLSEKSGGSPIVSELPREELFDKSLGKIIVIGRGKSVQKGAETSDTASIRWEATFRRVKP
jgi:hypothetical protein